MELTKILCCCFAVNVNAAIIYADDIGNQLTKLSGIITEKKTPDENYQAAELFFDNGDKVITYDITGTYKLAVLINSGTGVLSSDGELVVDCSERFTGPQSNRKRCAVTVRLGNSHYSAKSNGEMNLNVNAVASEQTKEVVAIKSCQALLEIRKNNGSLFLKFIEYDLPNSDNILRTIYGVEVKPAKADD